MSRGFHLRLFICLLSFLALAGCSGVTSSLSSPILGKWEVISGSSIGTLYEFFPDGAVSIGDAAGKYTWPDQSHLEVDVGQPAIYSYEISGNQLTLRDSSLQRSMVLQKYKELELTPENLAGNWKLSTPKNSDCFSVFGGDAVPTDLIIAPDGSLSFGQHYIIVGLGIDMRGTYQVNGHTLHITAAGIRGSGATNVQGTPIAAAQLEGELNCTATLSASRLTLFDANEQSTVFVRTVAP